MDGSEVESGSAGRGSNPDWMQGGTPLGECELGFRADEEPGRRCDWVYQGRCYATKVDACECACPRGRKGSVCSSDFAEPNGRTPVSCYVP
jgi:hypothetical protein